MRRWLALVALLLPAAAQAEPQQMVAAAHPMAVEAGLDVLKLGGSAIDAAVAVQMMLGVVEPQASGIGGIARVEEPARYFDVLKPLSSDLEVWETIYQQVLTGKDPVAQYTSSTGLRPFLEVLQEPERMQFYETYARLIAAAYPTRPDGITLFPFRRLFIVARRA